MPKKRGEIKVIENFPDGDPLAKDKAIARWIIKQQREKYGDESLSIAYPIWIRTKELEATGLSYSEAKEIAKGEYLASQRA